MQRLACPERDDWRLAADETGFDFHTIDGERYWDERACYAFTLEEIEHQIEGPTAEIDAMCLELVACAVDDEDYLRRLKIPEAFWPLIAESWYRDEASLYGRLDLSFDGRGPAKLLEYNADTPTSIFEAAVFQWTWLVGAIERRIIPAHADQFNSIHERLIEAWKKVGEGAHLHLAGTTENEEDAGTLAYLEDTARQAGLETTLIDIEDIGWRDDGSFVDPDNRSIELLFKLYPWEWIFHDEFGERLARAPTRWIEPPWKAILSNKGILPLLWEMFPDHPNLLPAFFEDDPNAASLGASFVRKPLYSREGANVTVINEGITVVEQEGSPGLRAAAEFFESISGRWKLADRPHAVRAVDPRGRESGHRQHVAVSAARNPLETCSARRRNHLQRMRHGGSDTRARRSGGVRAIKPASLRTGLEDVGDSDNGFGGTQRQYAVGFEHLCKAIEDAGLGVLVEIDHDVAAENHVERSKMRKILQQIQLPVLNHGADIGIELPQLAYLSEMLDQHLNGQPALDLELAEDAGSGFFKNPLRQIGSKNFNPPSRQRSEALEAYRDRIRLLPGGRCGTPDAQGTAGGARP